MSARMARYPLETSVIRDPVSTVTSHEKKWTPTCRMRLSRSNSPRTREPFTMSASPARMGKFERESLIRHVGVHFFSWLVTVLTGSRITDVSNGYRAIRADILNGLVLDQDQFWASELLIEVMRQRRRILEVPITVRARTSGVSKKPKTFKYARNCTKAIIQTWLR